MSTHLTLPENYGTLAYHTLHVNSLLHTPAIIRLSDVIVSTIYDGNSLFLRTMLRTMLLRCQILSD